MAAETTPREAEVAGAEIMRQEFGATQTQALVETASSAVAAAAQAEVQARWVIAQRNPRNWDKVRVDILKECARPQFADAGWYRKPIGGSFVEGFSIRFVEAAMRCMTNVLTNVGAIYDDPQKVIVRVSVTDLESNVTYPQEVIVQKTVERKQLRKGQVAISSRYNSQGQPVHVVAATDEDVLNKLNALVSKALRTLGLRLLPGDIQDECEEKMRAIRQAKVTDDPDAARKKMFDSFASIGVTPDQVQAYLGHDTATCSPAEIEELRLVFQGIKEGHSSWAEVLEAKTGASEEGESGDKLKELREKLDAAKAKKAATTPSDQAPPAAEQKAQSAGAAKTQPAIPKPIHDAIEARAGKSKTPHAIRTRVKAALVKEFGELEALTDEEKIRQATIAAENVEIGS